MGRRGVYEIAVLAEEQWGAIEALLKKYADREPRILTFDDDFGVYRWARSKQFRIVV